MKIFSSLIALVLLVLASACKKDNVEVKDENPAPVDADQIIIGDYSNMILTTYDTTIKVLNNEFAGYYIDLNNDLLPDFHYWITLNGTPTSGYIPQCTLFCKNPTSQVYGFTRKDTSFFNSIVRDTLFNTTNGPVEIHYENYSSCSRRNSSDDFSVNSKFILVPLHKGDIMKKVDSFEHSDVKWTVPIFKLGIPITSKNGDTTRLYHSTTYKNCDDFPNDQIIYVGIKININNVDKLGWIKIQTTGYELTIFEIAIQK